MRSVFSQALGRTIRYRNVPLARWTEGLRQGWGANATSSATSPRWPSPHRAGRYDRMTDDLIKLTGKTPTSMHDFVKLHAAAVYTARRTRSEGRPEGEPKFGQAAPRPSNSLGEKDGLHECPARQDPRSLNGGADCGKRYTEVKASIVSGGGLFALRACGRMADPRRMDESSCMSNALSVLPFGAPDQRTTFTPDRSPSRS